MSSLLQSVKSFASRLTLFSWALIVLVTSGLVIGGAYSISKNKSGAVEPVFNDSSGLVENIDDLPPVNEGDDETGEIMPPQDTSGQPPADITEDDLSYPPQ